MKNILLVFSLVSFFATSVLAFDCPKGGSKVTYTSQISGKTSTFCQINHNGKLVKHGDEVVEKGGTVVEKNYYLYGKVGIAPKKKEPESACQKYRSLINNYIKQLELQKKNYTTEKRIKKNRSDLCQENPQNRQMFALQGVPYTKKYEFRSNCHLNGDLRMEFGTPLKAKFKVKNTDDFTDLVLDYQWTKIKKKDEIVVDLKIKEGKFSNSKTSLLFNLHMSYRINVKEVMRSGGRGGIYENLPEVKLLAVDNTKCE